MTDYFSETYAHARARFLAMANERGAQVESISAQTKVAVEPEPFTDVALIGPRDASRSLVVVSGTHGPEGLTGSACQQALLDELGDADLPEGVSVLLVHAINAWGVAKGLRCTEEGMDLNRNYADFDAGLPLLESANAEYDAMHAFLHRLAGEVPADAFVADGPSLLVKTCGEDAVNTLFQGQYRHADGVGFGGFVRSAARRRFEHAVTRYLPASEKVAVVDLHTGLGPHGTGLKLSAVEADSKQAARAKRWYGDDVILINDPASNLPYRVFGATSVGVARALPNAQIVGLTLEYGTFEVDGLVRCILAEFLIRHRREGLDDEIEEKLKRDIDAFFYPTDDDWRRRVIAQALTVFSQALAGLG